MKTDKPGGSKRGPKPDGKLPLDVRVQPETHALLVVLQGETGLAPSDVAAMLLHMLINDPENAANRLKALAGRHASVATNKPSMLDRSSIA